MTGMIPTGTFVAVVVALAVVTLVAVAALVAFAVRFVRLLETFERRNNQFSSRPRDAQRSAALRTIFFDDRFLSRYTAVPKDPRISLDIEQTRSSVFGSWFQKHGVEMGDYSPSADTLGRCTVSSLVVEAMHGEQQADEPASYLYDQNTDSDVSLFEKADSTASMQLRQGSKMDLSPRADGSNSTGFLDSVAPGNDGSPISWTDRNSAISMSLEAIHEEPVLAESVLAEPTQSDPVNSKSVWASQVLPVHNVNDKSLAGPSLPISSGHSDSNIVIQHERIGADLTGTEVSYVAGKLNEKGANSFQSLDNAQLFSVDKLAPPPRALESAWSSRMSTHSTVSRRSSLYNGSLEFEEPALVEDNPDATRSLSQDPGNQIILHAIEKDSSNETSAKPSKISQEDVTELSVSLAEDRNWPLAPKRNDRRQVNKPLPAVPLKPILKAASKPAPTMAPIPEDGIVANLGGSLHEVIFPYNVQLGDEVELNLGDVICVYQVFDDGWCFGRKAGHTGAGGICPKACLIPAN